MIIDRLREILKDNQAAIISDDSNRRYISGFKSSAGVIYISKQSAVLFVDFRYFEKAKKEVTGLQVVLLTNLFDQLKKYITEDKITSVLVETDSLSVSDFLLYNKRLGLTISDDDCLVNKINKLRSVKTKTEIECIKTAQNFAEKTFEYILDRISVGRSEREIMLDMEFFMRRLGSEGVAFDFIVVSGKNSSLPHGVPTDKKIENGDFITMDFGARYNGYCSDMTRTVAVGDITDKQREVYNIVLDAQIKALNKIKAGAVCRDIDREARDYIYKCGYEGCFGHGLGHSLGIDVHENPSFNTRCETILKPGMIMTVEPGIYIENQFGVRIEDMVCVTQDGYVNLTNAAKDLIIL